MYPTDNLVIIAPIVFILLLVMFPVIGMFAGWKRATFWAGGNFLFYVIGLIVWTTTGSTIANALQPILSKIVSGIKGVTAEQVVPLARSLIAPVFFILILLFGNLILLINYYAWYKKIVVFGLKTKEQRIAYKKAKAAVHAAETDNARANAKANVKRLITPKCVTKAQRVGNSKAFNMTIGAIGMEILMLPTTITLTQACFYGTTSNVTRAKSSFANNLYNGLQNLTAKVDWFSYYDGKQNGESFDSLYCMLTANSQEITVGQYSGTVIEVTGKVIGSGASDLVDVTKSADINTDEGVTQIAETYNSLMSNITELMTDNGDVVNGMTGSDIVVNIIADTLMEQVGTVSTKLTEEDANKYFLSEDSTFQKIKTQVLEQGKLDLPSGGTVDITIIEDAFKISMSESSVDALAKSLVNKFAPTEESSLSDESRLALQDCVKDIFSAFVKYK